MGDRALGRMLGSVLAGGLCFALIAGVPTAHAATMDGSGFEIQLFGNADVMVTNVSAPFFGSGADLFFSMNGDPWTNAGLATSGSDSILLNQNDGDILNLALDLDGDDVVDKIASNASHADITYYNSMDMPGDWHTVTVNWKGIEPFFNFEVVSSLDGNTTMAPVPIPSSVLLLGSGLAGMIALRRKR